MNIKNPICITIKSFFMNTDFFFTFDFFQIPYVMACNALNKKLLICITYQLKNESIVKHIALRTLKLYSLYNLNVLSLNLFISNRKLQCLSQQNHKEVCTLLATLFALGAVFSSTTIIFMKVVQLHGLSFVHAHPGFSSNTP